MTDEHKQELVVELSWFMREIATRKKGPTDWEEIAGELIDKHYINHITLEDRTSIRHDFKRIAGALDKLFMHILPTIEESTDEE